MKGFINLFTSFIFAEVYRFAAYRIGIPQSLVQQVHFDDSILSISRDFFTKFDISSKKVWTFYKYEIEWGHRFP